MTRTVRSKPEESEREEEILAANITQKKKTARRAVFLFAHFIIL